MSDPAAARALADIHADVTNAAVAGAGRGRRHRGKADDRIVPLCHQAQDRVCRVPLLPRRNLRLERRAAADPGLVDRAHRRPVLRPQVAYVWPAHVVLGDQTAARIPSPTSTAPPNHRWTRAIPVEPRSLSATVPAASAYMRSLRHPSNAKLRPSTSTCSQACGASGSTNCGMKAKTKTMVFGFVRLTTTPCA